MWAFRFLAIMAVAAIFSCADRTGGKMLTFDGLDPPAKQFRGVLRLPEASKFPVPVVVMVHGSAGVDDRYDFHRPALLDVGIGTFEVDFKTGVFTSPVDRPPMATFHPWAFGALIALRSHPKIDPERIAIMGFSLGGHLSVSVASQKVKERWLEMGCRSRSGQPQACRVVSSQSLWHAEVISKPPLGSNLRALL